MDGGRTDDIVNGALGTGSVVKTIVGVVVSGMDGGRLRCIAVIAVDELGKREHGALSADAWRGKFRSHGCARGYEARCEG